MKQIFDEDSARDAKADDTQVRVYEKETAASTKKISNGIRRQSAWNTLFPKPTYSPEIDSVVW